MNPKHWNPFTKWWLLWGAAFAVIEGTAIVQRQHHAGGTLSSLVWRFTQRRRQKTLFMLGWALLTVHFIHHRMKEQPKV